MILPHPIDVHRFRSIVGIEEHERFLIDIQFLEQIQDPPRQCIQLKDKVSPGTTLRRPTEFLGRQHRGMGNLGGKHGEERFLRRFFPMSRDEVFRFLIEKQISVHEFIPGSHPSGIVVPTPLPTGVRSALGIVSLIRRHRHHPVLNVTIERIGRRAVWRHKRFIKAPFVRTIDQRSAFFVIDQKRILKTSSQALSILVKPRQSDMPFSEDPGTIPFLLKHPAQGQGARFEITRTTGTFKGPPTPTGGAIDLLARKKPVSRWRTNRRGAVGIGKPNPLLRHFIKARSFVSCLWIVAGQIPET